MSRGAYILPAARGASSGRHPAVDLMVGALTCPFGTSHMGITAENVASEQQITRDQQDAFPLESHRRAAAAIGAGCFKGQIVPVEIKTKRDKLAFDTDEHAKDTTIETLGTLKTVFKKDGPVTPGNATGSTTARPRGACHCDAAQNPPQAAGPGPRLRPCRRPPDIMGIGPSRRCRPCSAHRAVARRRTCSNQRSLRRPGLAVTGLGLDPVR